MAISEAQLAANRANAQKSTGPITQQGKDTTRLNAVRHGVTQQVMVMPAPQMQAYLDFNKEQQIAYAAANPIEKQLVQTIIDTQWRLNLARNIEFSLFADNYNRSEGIVQSLGPMRLVSLERLEFLGRKNKPIAGGVVNFSFHLEEFGDAAGIDHFHSFAFLAPGLHFLELFHGGLERAMVALLIETEELE
jgi:hypothetical protein